MNGGANRGLFPLPIMRAAEKKEKKKKTRKKKKTKRRKEKEEKGRETDDGFSSGEYD
jgi:hypothetical protein